MPTFLAVTGKGLVEPLAAELSSMGLEKIERVGQGVQFESNWKGCYRANLQSRIAARVLKPIQDFIAYTPEDLYGQLLNHDFTKYIDASQTLKVEASVTESKLHDQRFVAMKAKDAIVDQFQKEGGARPNVDTKTPDLKVFIKAYKNKFSVAIDTSGEGLYLRGYRKQAGDAPLRENIAAGLLQLAEWDEATPIVDPMCGSGTILIEAALRALKIAPGSSRRRFGFENLKGFKEEEWKSILDEAADSELEDLPFKFYGFDRDRKVIQMARENAKRAGVDHVIEFHKGDVATLMPPVERGLIITNPPYGARMGEEDLLKDVYRDFSHTLKHNFKGWSAWILSGNKDLIGFLKLKSTRRHFVFNGPLECRFLKYEMF